MTFAAALVDGDELAQAIERGRQLQTELVAAADSLAEADEVLRNERRRHQATLRKLERAISELDGHRDADERRLAELSEAHAEVIKLRREVLGSPS